MDKINKILRFNLLTLVKKEKCAKTVFFSNLVLYNSKILCYH